MPDETLARLPVVAVDLGDPGAVIGRETPIDALPAYAGPPEPVGGPPPEWGAAAADRPSRRFRPALLGRATCRRSLEVPAGVPALGLGGRSCRPSSASWPGSTGEGASSIRSEPDEVLGKAMTSRMLVWSVSSAAHRSTPSAMPPWGGAPYSKASRMPLNLASCCSGEWPMSANERDSFSRVWKRTEPPPSSQPLSARSYCWARACPAGSSSLGWNGSPDWSYEQRLVLRQDAR